VISLNGRKGTHGRALRHANVIVAMFPKQGKDHKAMNKCKLKKNPFQKKGSGSQATNTSRRGGLGINTQCLKQSTKSKGPTRDRLFLDGEQRDN